jgi:hypothetical protein
MAYPGLPAMALYTAHRGLYPFASVALPRGAAFFAEAACASSCGVMDRTKDPLLPASRLPRRADPHDKQ